MVERDVPAADVPETLEQQEMLQMALSGLEEQFKQPLLMVFMEGMTCRQVAQELDIPLGTVLSRLYRARLVLREKMARFYDPKDLGLRSEPGPAARGESA